ncbi:MAG: leucyl/phenylalanyl-tRNA--protein transferase [Verrucomicrobiae bacterium]|nr:leucyl/phenylalanyl-tRNA--protein transferase [Verrucomicrobiae bacterium]MCP5542224.1 leucyl/phenylalanyl-tRNA--protein transferase [Akkermansiaceae bacterium]
MAESIFTPEGYIRPALLLSAYRGGLFPMSLDHSGGIGWFSPDPRGIIPLDEFHIPHGLRRTLKRNPFEIRVDTAFGEVIRGCARRPTTWISPNIRQSYEKLHELGYAHSVETWRDGKLAGGLYGVAIGGAFFGESMFSRETDASKVALVALVERLRARGFSLLDTQWTTRHLTGFGCREIPRDDYLRLLAEALDFPVEHAFTDPGLAGDAGL